MDKTARMRVPVRAAALAVAIVVATVLGASMVDGAMAAPRSVVAQLTDANTPQPVGQSLPSKTQRVADSVITVLLLVTLAGALVAIATTSRWNHRPPRPNGAEGDGRDGHPDIARAAESGSVARAAESGSVARAAESGAAESGSS